MLSKFLNDNSETIARRISKLLVGEKKPVSLSKIHQELNDIENDVLNSVIIKYQNNFQFFQQPLIQLVTKIDFCRTHCSKNKACPGTQPQCTGLHMCKYYILSGKCSFGKKCTFGHDLNTGHNKKILHDNLLADITQEDLKFLLEHEENRTSHTVPRICKFYNVDKDSCRHTERGSDCPHLHICRHFIQNTCKFDKNCIRSHSILEDRNKEVLLKHGINVNRTDTEVVEDLRRALYGNGNTAEGSARRSTELEMVTLTNLKSEIATNTSETEPAKPGSLTGCKNEVFKKKESMTEGKQLCANVVADSVQFRYMSEINAIEKRNKSRRNSLADVLLDNFTGNATVICYCVDDSDNVHPFYLYGENCKDGVYVKSCKFEKGKSIALQGVYVCTPIIPDYKSRIETTMSSLGKFGIFGVQKCDERTVNKQFVCLKLVALLENPSRELSVTSAPLQNEKYQKAKASQLDRSLSFGQKRASDCSQDNGAKRRRISSVNSAGDCKPGVFQRFYSRQDSKHSWGNFIDTSGHQESALTWKAHGDALHSVCIIYYPGGGCATGFRVGASNNYIMTAAHVYDFIVKSQEGRVGGCQNTLANPDVFAVFDYLKDGELQNKKKFYFKDVIHFKNDEIDTLVLELEDHSCDTTMPPPFQHFKQPDYTKEFFFVGHSEGRPLAINKVVKIVNMQGETAKQDIINIRGESLQHTACPEYPAGNEYERAPYLTLENQHRHLFHCKFSHGASGSPGLVFLNDGKIVVVSMLLCGYPVWYYDPNMERFQANWSKDQKCVEQGVNISSVHAFMLSENPELCRDIFG